MALDTEGDSLHHYPERLALLQLAEPDGAVWLVDPLAVTDLTPLTPVFAEAQPLLLVHAGDNDLSHLKRRYGFAFRSIFDTAIAAHSSSTHARRSQRRSFPSGRRTPTRGCT